MTTETKTWVDMVGLADLENERGVAVLVPGPGRDQVAVFRVGANVHAIDHRDPETGANVLARGIVGSVGGRHVVASPLHKQRFDLETGECLEDPTMSVRVWPVRVCDGRILLAVDATSA